VVAAIYQQLKGRLVARRALDKEKFQIWKTLLVKQRSRPLSVKNSKKAVEERNKEEI
jgi:hypothetical protein